VGRLARWSRARGPIGAEVADLRASDDLFRKKNRKKFVFVEERGCTNKLALVRTWRAAMKRLCVMIALVALASGAEIIPKCGDAQRNQDYEECDGKNLVCGRCCDRL
jgi:hypothetical protein